MAISIVRETRFRMITHKVKESRRLNGQTASTGQGTSKKVDIHEFPETNFCLFEIICKFK